MTLLTNLAIVLNPEAGGGGRYDERRVRELRAIAGSRGVVFSTGKRELLDAVVEGARERGTRAMAIIGGDGTISSVLSALRRTYRDAPLPQVALLRGGTMNTIANSLGIPRKQPEELLRRLLDSEAETTVRRATIEVENRLGFLFSAGVMVGFLHVLYGTRDRGQGSLRALSLLAKGSWQALTGGELIAQIETPLLASVTLDGESHPQHRYTVLAGGTVEQIGLGFRPFPRAAERDDAFQVFAFHGSLQSLARQLPRIRRGLPMSKGLGFDPLAKELLLRTEGEFEYALDGDIYRATDQLLVKAGPSVQLRLS
ncbi:MAG: diacylglycerol/lipid kinase family protein [Polyangiales bacterium]